MLLRSITKHVKDQNWYAVGIDFFIVVVGVFIGIQVANWNEQKTFYDRETELLHELKEEIENSILITNQRIEAYKQVFEAGKRSLDFIENGVSCDTECWPVVVDFMHASQWQTLEVQRATYDNMRRLGLPKNRDINKAAEAYLAQNSGGAAIFNVLPHYRSLVRQLVPLEAQEFYWKSCWSVTNGIEAYDLDCPKGVQDDTALQIVATIIQHPDIKPHLTEWSGIISNVPTAFAALNTSARRVVTTIDSELESR